MAYSKKAWLKVMALNILPLLENLKRNKIQNKDKMRCGSECPHCCPLSWCLPGNCHPGDCGWPGPSQPLTSRPRATLSANHRGMLGLHMGVRIAEVGLC